MLFELFVQIFAHVHVREHTLEFRRVFEATHGSKFGDEAGFRVVRG